MMSYRGEGETLESLLPDHLLTRREVADLLNICLRKVDDLKAKGELDSVKLGKGRTAPVRFEPQEVMRYIRSCRESQDGSAA